MVFRSLSVCAAALLGAAPTTSAQFDTAITSAEVLAQAALSPQTDQESVTGPAYPSFQDFADAAVKDGANRAFAGASAELEIAFPASNEVQALAFVRAETLDGEGVYEETDSFASGFATFCIEFEAAQAFEWNIVLAQLDGTNGSASMSFVDVSDGTTIFEYQNIFVSGVSDFLPAGRYKFTATASAFEAIEDGPGNADAGFEIVFGVIPVPTPASGVVLGMGMIAALRRRRRS